jgi:hypothetical protein
VVVLQLLVWDGATTPRLKKQAWYECFTRVSDLMDSLDERRKRRKKGLTFGKYDVRHKTRNTD